MFSGGDRQIAPTYYVRDEKLTLRPYNQRLGELTAKICSDIGQAEQDKCLFETRTAFDCLARHKARKFGDISDNQTACRVHVNNMKQALGPENEGYLQTQIEKLVFSRTSFV